MAVAAFLGMLSASASAQQPAQGFALDRLYLSAPGAGWFVMDALDMQSGLGAALSLSTEYARNPWVVTQGTQRLAVVSDEVIATIGIAVTFDRWRISLGFDAPLFIYGQSGVLNGYSFTAPSVDLNGNPDTLSDPRLGLDIRLVGDASSRFRLGLSAQLVFPNGNRADDDTDGTFRAMDRIVFAGDEGMLTYAGHVGIHVRPLDDSPIPGSPRGSELLFGLAAGARVSFGRGATLVVGPELFGATAFQSLFAASASEVEALLSGRLEGTMSTRYRFRLKLGVGTGINRQFGAPEWRLVGAFEVSSRDPG